MIISTKNSLLIVAVVAVAISVILIDEKLSNKIIRTNEIVIVEKNSTIEIKATKNVTGINLPVRVRIPRIAVNARLEKIGLLENGAVDIPKNPVNAAWYKLGPRPGEKGNSIIAGHSGWSNDTKAVFDGLDRLQKQDKIYIEDKNGSTTTFIVRDIRSYKENDDATEVFISNDGKVHLNLISCEGAWNIDNKSYSERIVIFADLEKQTSFAKK